MTKLKAAAAFSLLIFGGFLPGQGTSLEMAAFEQYSSLPAHHFEKNSGVFAKGHEDVPVVHQSNVRHQQKKQQVEDMWSIRTPLFKTLTDHDLHERFEKKDVSHLKVLIAPFKSITDKSFDNLAYATHLKILDLSENQRITDRGIEKIQHLRHLEILRLSSTEITDASVPYIKQFTALKELNVLNTLLSKEGVDEIKKAIPALEAPGAFIYNPFLDMKE